jgi:hypothetical protein
LQSEWLHFPGIASGAFSVWENRPSPSFFSGVYFRLPSVRPPSLKSKQGRGFTPSPQIDPRYPR